MFLKILKWIGIAILFLMYAIVVYFNTMEWIQGMIK